MGISQVETTERPPERPGIPSIRIRRDTGLVMRRSRYTGQPQFGDNLPGRPYHTANLQIPTTQEEIDQLYDEYYGVLAELHYGEAMSLCRALRYSYSTYLMRRYKHRKAKLPEVVMVVGWYRSGKPMIVKKHKLTIASLFHGG